MFHGTLKARKQKKMRNLFVFDLSKDTIFQWTSKAGDR